MWSAPAKVTFPDGKTFENIVFGEYDIDDGLTGMAVFLRASDREAYMKAGGFGSTSETILLETDITNAVDISPAGHSDVVQKLETGAGIVIVDWR